MCWATGSLGSRAELFARRARRRDGAQVSRGSCLRDRGAGVQSLLRSPASNFNFARQITHRQREGKSWNVWMTFTARVVSTTRSLAPSAWWGEKSKWVEGFKILRHALENSLFSRLRPSLSTITFSNAKGATKCRLLPETEVKCFYRRAVSRGLNMADRLYRVFNLSLHNVKIRIWISYCQCTQLQFPSTDHIGLPVIIRKYFYLSSWTLFHLSPSF